jgi:phage terminase large subunit-like protein
VTPRDPARLTRGDWVSAHLARLKRALPYPWQMYVNDVAGELNDAGDGFRYPIVVLSVPRRAGKTVDVVATALDRMDINADVRGWYTAQRREDAAKQFRDEWVPMLEPLDRLYRLRRAQGSEGVHKRKGYSRLQLFPPTETALHGQNADVVFVDEAWWFDTVAGEAIEAGVRPAQLTRPWRQLWIVSAGGTIESTWFDGWLQMGEQATPGVALFDFGADAAAPDYDPGNPRVWWQAHPALGLGFPQEVLAQEWSTKRDVASFERSYLNVWPRPSLATVAAGVDLDAWARAARPKVQFEAISAIALDVSRDRSWSSIAAAGWRGDRLVVEVLEHRPGIGWIAAAVKAIKAAQRRRIPVVADSLVAASIVNELTRAYVDVTPVGATEHARACSAFVDLLTTGVISHRSQQVLDEAITGAARRPLGDGWLWSRSRSTVDISPLVAVTLAAGAGHARRASGRAQLSTPEVPETRPR